MRIARIKHMQLLALTISLLAIIGTFSIILFPTSSQAATATTIHHPDLITREPFNMNILVTNGQKLLRFSNTVYNVGDGPLELRPQNLRGGSTDIYQRYYSHDAQGRPYLVSENRIGSSVFHKAHHHWHFERFALYELYSDLEGSMNTLITANPKTTFCIINTDTYPGAPLEHAGWGGNYAKCTKTSVNGLSVGSGDTYHYNLEGQNINITNVPNGCYWIKSTANPDRLISEKDYTNNENAKRIYISGTTVSSTCP